MKRRTKLILLASCVAVVLGGATAVGLALAHRYKTPTTSAETTLAQKSASTESSRDASSPSVSAATGGAPTGSSAAAPGASASSGTKASGSSGGKFTPLPTNTPIAAGQSGSSSGTKSSGGSGSSSSSGANSNSANASAPKPTTPAPTPKPKPATVTVLVSCRTVLSNTDKLKASKKSVVPPSGVILGSQTVTLQSGDTVFSVLKRACQAAGVSLDSSQMPGYSAYIKGIGNLEEFDCGPQSGWVYSVNGAYSSTGCSKYTVKAGDAIAFRYTCNGGADVGASGAR